MPIYEYTCPDCGHDFEVLQKFSDDPVRVCPTCKAENVRKRISLASFALKGDGWYKDHYGLKKSGGSSESSSSSSSTSTSTPSSTTSTSSGSTSSGSTSSGSTSSSPAPAK